VNYEIRYANKVTGTICLSFKYKSFLKDVEHSATHHSEVEEIKLNDLDFESLPIEFGYGEGRPYSLYNPEGETEEEKGEVRSNSSDEEFMTWAERNRAYHKRFLYFVPKSSQIYEYNRKKKDFKEISTQKEIVHPQDMQATELPDGSYLLTGGRDHKTNELTSVVVHYFNDQYFGRADILTPRVEHSAIYVKGFVYVFGGYNSDGVLKSIQAHDMNNNVWIDCGELQQARYRASVCKFDENYVYILGGCVNFDIDPF
jgi:hypothetical protein